MTNLLLAQNACGTEARHDVAGVERMRIPDSRPGVALNLHRVTAELAVLIKGGADIAVGDFFL